MAFRKHSVGRYKATGVGLTVEIYWNSPRVSVIHSSHSGPADAHLVTTELIILIFIIVAIYYIII